MSAGTRVLFRNLLCAAFIASLYGGMAILTAAMFAQGHALLAIVSGFVLAVMTATMLALFRLAWSMVSEEREEDLFGIAVQPG